MNWFESFWKALNSPSSGHSPSESETMNNFTPRAQQVLALARKEADRFNHNFVGTEHLLLGLIRLGQGTAVTVLEKMGLNLDVVRQEVEKQVGTGPDEKMVGNVPCTPRVKMVLALAAKEAASLNHTFVGTEDILLGLLLEGDGVAARVLKNLNVDIDATRKNILKELDPNLAAEPTAIDKPKPRRPESDTIDLTKRYDVYCREGDEQVVYENAKFKGTKLLFHRGLSSEFIELEQADGQTMFISTFSLIKFCEHR
jgi:ATP-dependent Clp protease ATP-binding subunit ClpA